MSKIDTEIDQLFQLPLAEFTSARNALAKGAGRDGTAIKALAKPPVAAWAVNQLYWKDREQYAALVDAAKEMRRAHKAVIEGKGGDLRATGREHELALDAAFKATLALLKNDGQPVTEATRHAILNTLRALPSDEPPGRLTRTLSPGGFEMLAGIKPAAGGPRVVPAPSRLATARPTSKHDAKAEREAAKARERRVALERAVREADQRARQAEFEAARAARDVAKTQKRLEEARRALDEAREAFESAEREAAAANRTKESAERRARDAESALEAARAKLE